MVTVPFFHSGLFFLALPGAAILDCARSEMVMLRRAGKKEAIRDIPSRSCEFSAEPSLGNQIRPGQLGSGRRDWARTNCWTPSRFLCCGRPPNQAVVCDVRVQMLHVSRGVQQRHQQLHGGLRALGAVSASQLQHPFHLPVHHWLGKPKALPYTFSKAVHV